MLQRLALTIVVLTLSASACSLGGSDDQPIKPAKAPAGWSTSKLDGITLATPPAWQQGATKQETKTLQSTSWRAPIVDGASPAGVEVRVITKPQQNAKKAARALALSAMALLESGKIEPEEISWPHAKLSYYFAYEATFGEVGKKRDYAARTFVHDLADGRQIQVTALVEKGAQESTPGRVLSAVKLPATKGD